jgi:hypothetical protein
MSIFYISVSTKVRWSHNQQNLRSAGVIGASVTGPYYKRIPSHTILTYTHSGRLIQPVSSRTDTDEAAKGVLTPASLADVRDLGTLIYVLQDYCILVGAEAWTTWTKLLVFS